MFDAGGLYIEIAPSGGKWWRFKYRFGGKEKRLSLGVYPEVSLKVAQERREDVRRKLADGIDPAHARKAHAAIHAEQVANSFELVAREWFSKLEPTWVPAHSKRVILRLENDAFPWIGAMPIASITAPILLATIRRIEARGKIDTAHRVLQICGQVFRYAIQTGRAERDPAADLKGALQPTVVKHYASTTDPKKIGGLLRAIDGYEGTFVIRCALQFAPLVFVRPGELRYAKWSEFDLDKAEWRIPAERMKMRVQHIVPLSTQAVAILRDLHPLTGRWAYVFPGARTKDQPMSENTVNAALRRMGFEKTEMTGHGFRSMASTILNEQGYPPDAIERQLAHSESNSIRAAYNYAQYLPERRRMMQAWADYLDGLKAERD
jgi:integrase